MSARNQNALFILAFATFMLVLTEKNTGFGMLTGSVFAIIALLMWKMPKGGDEK